MSIDPVAVPPRNPRTRTRSRSLSPIIAFSSAPLPNDKGVQNITRKVIRRLEGLGHLELVDMYATPEDDTDVPSSNVSDGGGGEREMEVEAEDERAEVERALYDELVRRDGALNGNGHANGHVNGHATANGVVAKSPKQRQKVDWEIPRKLLHSSIGFFTMYFYISESDVSKIVFVLWTSLCIIVPADVLRLRSPRFERIYERFLGFLMRESEKTSTNGVIWYILGALLALTFYPADIAVIAIIILSWADTAASTIGRFYGPSSRRLPTHIPFLRIPLAPRKSMAGFVAACLTGGMIAIGFWALIAPVRFAGRDVSWDFVKGVRLGLGSGVGNGSEGFLGGWVGLGVIGVVAGLVSGVAEAMDLGSWDDNLTLPVISGGCLFGFLKLAGWLGKVWTSS
ncbi:hypothetical protein P691DRAFT_738019 [Macrolepiota fuliginosa MF-IS2]|uniref:Phosphatidate cytidylyltransferase n=1 Tax=Macrolepiota fuliginosa MF-IS2 TaxID=1400762 RepID=A0A9P6BZE2_9AGAR|nr:hypothetical protein P691DRAFT_738019 [Macrolepiota fuliginosa MF-IS2]